MNRRDATRPPGLVTSGGHPQTPGRGRRPLHPRVSRAETAFQEARLSGGLSSMGLNLGPQLLNTGAGSVRRNQGLHIGLELAATSL